MEDEKTKFDDNEIDKYIESTSNPLVRRAEEILDIYEDVINEPRRHGSFRLKLDEVGRARKDGWLNLHYEENYSCCSCDDTDWESIVIPITLLHASDEEVKEWFRGLRKERTLRNDVYKLRNKIHDLELDKNVLLVGIEQLQDPDWTRQKIERLQSEMEKIDVKKREIESEMKEKESEKNDTVYPIPWEKEWKPEDRDYQHHRIPRWRDVCAKEKKE